MTDLKLKDKICLSLGIISTFLSLGIIFPYLGEDFSSCDLELVTYSFMLASSISLIIISLFKKVESKITILSLGLLLISINYPYIAHIQGGGYSSKILDSDCFIFLSSILIFIFYILSFYFEDKLKLITAALVISLGLFMLFKYEFFTIFAVSYFVIFTAISLTKFRFKEGE